MKEKNKLAAERLKQCRIKSGNTLEQIGTLCGVHKTTVMRWEKGEIERIGLPTIQLLASFYNVNPAWLSGFDVTESSANTLPDNIIPLPNTKNIPLLGDIACGDPLLATENISDYIKVDISLHVDFALKCKGDSMINARIFDGDIVYIRQQPDVDDGEIAAVLIGDEATLKKVYRTENKLVLRPCNPMYDDLVYSNDALSEVHILGKAVMFTSLIRHGK